MAETFKNVTLLLHKWQENEDQQRYVKGTARFVKLNKNSVVAYKWYAILQCILNSTISKHV